MRIKINGYDFENFNDVAIQTTLASVASTFSFTTGPVLNPLQKKLLRPLQYSTVQFYDETKINNRNKGLLSTGTLLKRSTRSAAGSSVIQHSGYSRPGVLEDCQLPVKYYPLEFTGLSLKQIATKICGFFNIRVIIYDSVTQVCDQAIPKAVCKPEESLKNFICKIASQKNVIVSHDIFGDLIMFKPEIDSTPTLSIDTTNTVEMSLDIDGQGMHSELTSIRQPEKSSDGTNPFTNEYDEAPDFPAGGSKPKKSFKIGSDSTVYNPMVKAFRPSVDVLSSGTFYNTLTAAKNRRGAELQNIRIGFTLSYWPEISVGDVIEVLNPELDINKKTKLVLDSTTIFETADKKYFSGTLVLPETFTGEDPRLIFE